MTKRKWPRRVLLVIVTIFVALSLYWGMLLRRGVRAAERFLTSVGRADQLALVGEFYAPDRDEPRRVHAALTEPQNIEIVGEIFEEAVAAFDFQASYSYGLEKTEIADTSWAVFTVHWGDEQQTVYLVAPDMLFGNLATVMRLDKFDLNELFGSLDRQGLLIDTEPPSGESM